MLFPMLSILTCFSMGDSLVDDNGTKNERDGEKVLPCEAWWKRHAICLYKNVKEANTIWSVLVATALMGLVILGHRWHKEKFQVNSRWRFNINNEVGQSFCFCLFVFRLCSPIFSIFCIKFKTLLSKICCDLTLMAMYRRRMPCERW